MPQIIQNIKDIYDALPEVFQMLLFIGLFVLACANLKLFAILVLCAALGPVVYQWGKTDGKQFVDRLRNKG